MDSPINIEVDWRYVAGVVFVLGFAFINYLRDRNNVVSRVIALEQKLKNKEGLLSEKFHSDIDKLIPVAAAIQAAARARGKELIIEDIALYLREKRLRKEKEAKGAMNNERT